MFCFWDKHPFVNNASNEIRCPIAYKPRQVVHKKKEYYINQNVSRSDNIPVDSKVIPEQITYTDLFCSEQCLLAWINENTSNPLYKNSKYIFFNEYYKKNSNTKITPANHWRTLKAFGGFLTIEQFRSCTKHYEEENVFIDDKNVRQVEYAEVMKIQ